MAATSAATLFMSPERHQDRAFFGRRKGHKLRPHHARLIETLLPRLAIDLSDPAPAELSALFPVPVDDIQLEIGFGGGEYLIAQAQARPHTGFIGIEPFVNGMAKALAAIESGKLQNIRLHFDDAVNLMAWLPQNSLARIDLIHPDPWPKRRHWKRRFVQDATVSRLARILAPGGEFRFVTDIAAPAALGGFRMDGARCRRLAKSLARLRQHALPRQGRARRARIVFFDFP
jgi:tRNA (guanine-N7-)-methyltransferase